MANKISIQNNRIIFDGHAETLRECQLITAVCDSLSASENFRTIKYESGYAEFEKVSGGDKALFAPWKDDAYYIYSNDGATKLFTVSTTETYSTTIKVTATGFDVITKSALVGSTEEAYVSESYTYSGDKTFMGLATSVNADEPVYGIGAEYELYYAGDGDTYYLYIVQSEITDLTNTTWYIPSGWSAEAGYGLFNVYGTIDKFDGEFGSALPDPDLNEMDIGYGFDDWEQPPTTDYIWLNNFPIIAKPNHSFTLTITSGTDVKNPKLIAWLKTNGTQLKVTDLTDTTWNVTVFESSFDDNFTLNGTVSYNGIDYVLDDVNCNFGVNSTYVDLYYVHDEYLYIPVNGNFTISITGGTDTTNPKLIAWLSKYGELQGEEEEKIPTLTYDLSQLNLLDGTHSITVVAKADGYSNSAPSNAVEISIEKEQ